MKHRGIVTRLGVLASAVLISTSLPYTAFAHGEDKPGPNGGEIRMPGAFHTEVKKEGTTLKVYLLDFQFENPTVSDSAVEAKLREGKKETSLSCKPQGVSFTCDLPKGERLNKGELVVKAKRAGAQGADAVYKLPLLSKAKSSGPAGHSGHDHSGHGGHHGH